MLDAKQRNGLATFFLVFNSVANESKGQYVSDIAGTGIVLVYFGSLNRDRSPSSRLDFISS